MLGEYLITIVFILVVIGMVSIFLKNTIPGILQGFIAVLKVIFYLALIPLVALGNVFNFLFSKRSRFAEFVVKTVTITKRSIDSKGNVYSRSKSVQTHEKIKDKMFKSIKF